MLVGKTVGTPQPITVNKGCSRTAKARWLKAQSKARRRAAKPVRRENASKAALLASFSKLALGFHPAPESQFTGLRDLAEKVDKCRQAADSTKDDTEAHYTRMSDLVTSFSESYETAAQAFKATINESWSITKDRLNRYDVVITKSASVIMELKALLPQVEKLVKARSQDSVLVDRRISGLHTKFQEIQDDINDLKRAFESIVEIKIYNFNDRLWQPKLNAAKKEAHASNATIKEDFKKHNKLFGDRLTAMEEKYDALSQKNREISEENNDLKKTQKSMVAEIATKDGKIEFLKAECESSSATTRAEKAWADEIQSFMETTLGNLESWKESLENSISRNFVDHEEAYKSSIDKVDGLVSTLETLRSSCSDLQTLLDQLQTDINGIEARTSTSEHRLNHFSPKQEELITISNTLKTFAGQVKSATEKTSRDFPAQIDKHAIISTRWPPKCRS